MFKYKQMIRRKHFYFDKLLPSPWWFEWESRTLPCLSYSSGNKRGLTKKGQRFKQLNVIKRLQEREIEKERDKYVDQKNASHHQPPFDETVVIDWEGKKSLTNVYFNRQKQSMQQQNNGKKRQNNWLIVNCDFYFELSSV